MAKGLDRQLVKEDVQMANRHMKRYSTSYVIRKLQIQPIVRCHYTPKSKTLKTLNVGKDVEQQELSFIAGGNAKWYTHFERQLVVSYKTEHTLTIRSSSCAFWCLPKWAENLCPLKNMYADVYSSFIHNCQNLGSK